MSQRPLPPQNDVQLQAALQGRFDSIASADPNRIMAMLAPRLLQTSYAARTMQISYDLAPWMLNAMDILHGGILSTMLDNTMGSFTHAFTGQSTLTLNLQVSFLAPVRLEQKSVYIECEIQSLTNRFAHLRATAWAGGQAPVATATGIFYLK